MKTSSEGFQQCYNAQVAVDAEQQLVVATDLTANASDQGGLPVLLDAVKETFDAQPERVLADAGYCNERDLKDLEKRGVDGYVAPGREGKQAATRDLEKHPACSRSGRWPMTFLYLWTWQRCTTPREPKTSVMARRSP